MQKGVEAEPESSGVREQSQGGCLGELWAWGPGYTSSYFIPCWLLVLWAHVDSSQTVGSVVKPQGRQKGLLLLGPRLPLQQRAACEGRLPNPYFLCALKDSYTLKCLKIHPCGMFIFTNI